MTVTLLSELPTWQTLPSRRTCQIFTGHCYRVPVTCALPHSTYRRVLIVHTRHLSACQIQTSRGNATTSLDLIRKQTLAITLNCVTFTDSRWEKAK
jgi:hypothetical protein